VEPSVQRISQALGATGAATILVYPALEHLLNVVPDGLPERDREAAIYTFRDFTFGPRVRDDFTEWLLAGHGSSPPPR
jgi:hypothetical protein